MYETFSALAVLRSLTFAPCLEILSIRSAEGFDCLDGLEEIVAGFLAGSSASAGPSALFF